MSDDPESRGAAALPEKTATSNSSKAPFIPAWLDDAGLSAATFRVYSHLARSADNSSGIAWPSYQRMTAICGLGKSTVRRCLEELEARKMIAKAGKPFGGSCRYRVFPIVPLQGQMDVANSSTSDPIEAAPIVPPQDCNSPSDGTSIVPPQGQEGYPLKVPKKKVPQNEDTPIEPPSPDELKLEIGEPAVIAAAIYQRYPRKEGKADGIKAILKAMKRHDAKFLLERTEAYAEAIAWKERQFIPHPATWFNGERFNDDPEAWKEPAPRARNGKAPIAEDEIDRLLGRRSPNWSQNHRKEKAAREYPQETLDLPD